MLYMLPYIVVTLWIIILKLSLLPIHFFIIIIFNCKKSLMVGPFSVLGLLHLIHIEHLFL